MYNSADYEAPTRASNKIADTRFPDLRKLLTIAGYEENVQVSRLNQTRKDELFTNAYILEKDHDSLMVRTNSGTVLDFDTYTWIAWLAHPIVFRIANELGLLKVVPGDTSNLIELDDEAFSQAQLEIFGG